LCAGCLAEARKKIGRNLPAYDGYRTIRQVFTDEAGATQELVERFLHGEIAGRAGALTIPNVLGNVDEMHLPFARQLLKRTREILRRNMDLLSDGGTDGICCRERDHRKTDGGCNDC
jgi:hypothetical protein